MAAPERRVAPDSGHAAVRLGDAGAFLQPVDRWPAEPPGVCPRDRYLMWADRTRLPLAPGASTTRRYALAQSEDSDRCLAPGRYRFASGADDGPPWSFDLRIENA